MNIPLLPLTAVLVFFAGLALWFLHMRPQQTANTAHGEHIDTVIGWQPRSTRVMTLAEQQIYDLLREALPDHVVLSQVPLSRFIKVSTRHSYLEWLRRVGNQCVDLLVCDRASKVVAVVEIQSSLTTPNSRTAKRTARKARSLKAAGVAVHIWSDHALPDIAQIRKLFAVQSTVAPTPTSSPPDHRAARPMSPPAQHYEDTVMDDDGAGFNDAPPSTWFDDADSSPMPLTTKYSTISPPAHAAHV